MARPRDKVPRALQVQLARLLGNKSSEANRATRSPAEWRRTIKALLRELDRYQSENVHTDAVHQLLLSSGLYAASESLKEEDFWPGVVEGLSRFALTLMGDYPDHQRRRGHAKSKDYYSLNRYRRVAYHQDPEQRFRLLWMASDLELFDMPRPMWKVMAVYYDEYGRKRSRAHFLDWFGKTFPEPYAAIF